MLLYSALRSFIVSFSCVGRNFTILVHFGALTVRVLLLAAGRSFKLKRWVHYLVSTKQFTSSCWKQHWRASISLRRPKPKWVSETELLLLVMWISSLLARVNVTTVQISGRSPTTGEWHREVEPCVFFKPKHYFPIFSNGWVQLQGPLAVQVKRSEIKGNSFCRH